MSERTDAEIVAFYGARKAGDWMGTIGADVLAVLPFSVARPFLVETATDDDWQPLPRDRDSVIERMRDYMTFAWGKALDHRGISAGRSIDHFRAWLFLLGDDEMLAVADDDDSYPNYGAPILAAICEKYGIPIPEGEDAQRMARGESCQPGCENGCGR